MKNSGDIMLIVDVIVYGIVLGIVGFCVIAIIAFIGDNDE